MSDQSKPSEAALCCAKKINAQFGVRISERELAEVIDEEMQHSVPLTRPLPEGTRIEWDGVEAVVVHDAGGDLIEVIPDNNNSLGGSSLWHWTICGITCKVIQ